MATLDLLSGPVTLSAALANSRDVVHSLKYPHHKREFFKHIENYRPQLHHIIAHHLGTKSTDVTISSQDYWRHGSFNLCVPVHVDTTTTPTLPQFVMLRFPLPYRVGEARFPGNSDEKLTCEAATYAWLQENCPSIRIPQLYGFGLSTHESFTHLEFLPWWSRWAERARRLFLTVFRFKLPSSYVCHRPRSLAKLDIGYLLIETIDFGEPLSESWDEKRDEVRLDNLQRDLAAIMVSLASIPLPRIGSFRLDSSGYLRLDNRPLRVQSAVQENEGIPLNLPRQATFSSVKDFLLQHLTAFDNRLLYQPNAITGRSDACYQMTSLAAARVVFPQMFRKDLCHGPFVFALTDLHRSNIIVDEDWNIVCIIDLEFACSWPVEFVQPPYWLGGGLIDEIEPTDFAPRYTRFVEFIKQAEQRQGAEAIEPLSRVMQRAWTDGVFWVRLAIMDPVAFTEIFYDRILLGYLSYSPEDLKKADYEFLARLWRLDFNEIIDKKLQDRDEYLERLKAAFAGIN